MILNRQEKRTIVRDTKQRNKSNKRTKGAFGEKPSYLKKDKLPSVVVREKNIPYKVDKGEK